MKTRMLVTVLGVLALAGGSTAAAETLLERLHADRSSCERFTGTGEWQLKERICVPNERIREAQLQTLELPETGMASAVDLGGGDVHALNKQDIGHRLALVALAKTYGHKIPYSGPLYRSHTIEGNRIRVTFDHAEAGLLYGLKDGLKPVQPLAAGETRPFWDENGKPKTVARGELKSVLIAGEDKKWVPAATVIDGSTLVVFSPQVSKPVAVRYAYVEDPSTAPLGENCLLYNKEGLPASPFRTDDW